MDSNSKPKSRLLLLPEVAERLRKTEAQFRYMVSAGKAPKGAKVLGRLVWREDELEAWIDEQFAKASA